MAKSFLPAGCSSCLLARAVDAGEPVCPARLTCNLARHRQQQRELHACSLAQASRLLRRAVTWPPWEIARPIAFVLAVSCKAGAHSEELSSPLTTFPFVQFLHAVPMARLRSQSTMPVIDVADGHGEPQGPVRPSRYC